MYTTIRKGIFFLILVMPRFLDAQQKVIYGSLNSGFTYSTVKENIFPAETNYLSGAAFSLNFGMGMWRHAFMETGLGYYQNGFRMKIHQPINTISFQSARSYIESDYRYRESRVLIPMKAGMEFGQRHLFSFYVGIYGSVYLFTQASFYDNLYIDPSEIELFRDPSIISSAGEKWSEELFVASNHRAFDGGVLGGVRYAYAWNSFAFGLSLEYLQGLLDVNTLEVFVSDPCLNRSWMVMAGIRYTFQRSDSGE